MAFEKKFRRNTVQFEGLSRVAALNLDNCKHNFVFTPQLLGCGARGFLNPKIKGH